MNCAVALYAWYAVIGTDVPAGGVKGSGAAGPSCECRLASCSTERAVPLGLRGPVIDRRLPTSFNWLSASERLAGWSQIGAPNCSSSVSGLLLATGKWAAIAAAPAAESLPAGALLAKPPVVKPTRPAASAANTITP